MLCTTFSIPRFVSVEIFRLCTFFIKINVFISLYNRIFVLPLTNKTIIYEASDWVSLTMDIDNIIPPFSYSLFSVEQPINQL